MPKIIEDIKKIILTEAKRQLMNNGYSGMTLRSVATGCNIAVGTIYNYFPSKDDLIASFMLEDWIVALAKMKACCAAVVVPTDVFACVYRAIVNYSDQYVKLFDDVEAKRNADGIFSARHSMLCSQIVALIKDICRENAIHYTDYLPEFIAEAILYHAAGRKEFSSLSEILAQLFKAAPQDAMPL